MFSSQQACTCAERKEVNKALVGENSVFTRRGRAGSERAGHNNENRQHGRAMGNNKKRDAVPDSPPAPSPLPPPSPKTAAAPSTQAVLIQQHHEDEPDAEISQAAERDDNGLIAGGPIDEKGISRKSIRTLLTPIRVFYDDPINEKPIKRLAVLNKRN